MTDHDREAFEAWVSDAPYEKNTARYNSPLDPWPGQYKRVDVELAWQAWLAALAHRDKDIADLQRHLDELVEVLRAARSDIFQTARSNQCNLTGQDIVFPDDAAIPELIGKNTVHQAGVDESLRLEKRIRETLARIKTTQPKESSDGQ